MYTLHTYTYTHYMEKNNKTTFEVITLCLIIKNQRTTKTLPMIRAKQFVFSYYFDLIRLYIYLYRILFDFTSYFIYLLCCAVLSLSL